MKTILVLGVCVGALLNPPVFHPADSLRPDGVVDKAELEMALKKYEWGDLSVSEILRVIQIYQAEAYWYCRIGEDNFCLGKSPNEICDLQELVTNPRANEWWRAHHNAIKNDGTHPLDFPPDF